jgi:hypothetical protein
MMLSMIFGFLDAVAWNFNVRLQSVLGFRARLTQAGQGSEPQCQ